MQKGQLRQNQKKEIYFLGLLKTVRPHSIKKGDQKLRKTCIHFKAYFL